MKESSLIERSNAQATRGGISASLWFGRRRASTYWACGRGLVVSWAALGIPEVVSATGLLNGPWDAAPSLALGSQDTEKAPVPSESDTPFDEAEQTDPNEPSRGEERPESDGEKVFVDGRGITSLERVAGMPEVVVSVRPVHEAALESQFQPDGLERPPRV